MKRTQADRIGAPGSLEELQRELAGALMPSSVEELQRQFAASLEQQAAIAQILDVISRSPSDIQPVLDAIAKSAVRLTGAETGGILRAEDGGWRMKAFAGTYPDEAEYRRRAEGMVIQPGRGSAAGRVLVAKATIQIEDIEADPEFERTELSITGSRTVLGVPLLREGEPVGVIVLRRTLVAPFTLRQIQLVETFASQAVIAIENVRLFNETKEGLERQTAIAEILGAISGSPTDVQPVLDAIAESAARFCAAEDATVMLVRGSELRASAHHGSIATPIERPDVPLPAIPIDVTSVGGRAIVEKRVLVIDDILAEAETYPRTVPRAIEFGYRSMAVAPLIREGAAIGLILLRRAEVRPFVQREIDLLKTFADQAVIAIENVRLFNETREALEQQTASAEILRVIAASPTDVQPVLNAIAESAADLCAADDAVIGLVEGDMWGIWAHHGPVELRPDSTSPIGDQFVSGHAMLERRTIRVDDLQSDVGRGRYPGGARVSPTTRAIMATPLLRQGNAIGAIFVRRNEAVPFTERHAALIEAFASQAVIAIENVRLFNETKEALQQQTAVADVLASISRSAFDLDTVLQTIVDRAAGLSGADSAVLRRIEGDSLVELARYGDVPAGAITDPLPLDGPTLAAVSVRTSTLQYVEDIRTRPELPQQGPRTRLAVPMVRDGKALGTFLLSHIEVRPFSDREMQLVQTFADQAAIAIENVRLFNETKEALERQIATAEVLEVISRSTTDLVPVFQTIAEKALRLCEGDNVSILHREGEVYRHVAGAGFSTAEAAEFEQAGPLPLRPGRGSLAGRVLVQQRSVQIVDTAADPEYDLAVQYSTPEAFASMPSTQSLLGVPMIRAGDLIGVIIVRRRRVGRYTDKQTALLEVFAAQAVIAIENVRLFNETKEALERQTATAEILRVISESPTDVQPVLDAIAESAARFCSAEDASIGLLDGSEFSLRAHYGQVEILHPSLHPDPSGRQPGTVSDEFVSGHAIVDRRTIHVSDLRSESARARYPKGAVVSPTTRAIMATPLLRQGEPIGAIFLRRTEPVPFTDRQIEFVEAFASQAVIAIENVRLFNETKEALEQQAATARVLQVISRSAFDLRSALETLVEEAARLCAADHGSIHRWDGSAYRTAAFWGPSLSEEYKREGFESPRYPGRDTLVGRTALERDVVHILDATTDPEYKVQSLQKLGGYRTMLGVPLMRDGFPIGVFALMRGEVQPFTDRQIELVRTFADQAAIAIENVRLFNETKEALEQQSATRAVLEAISAAALDLDRIFRTIVENSVQLCRASSASLLIRDGEAYRPAAHAPVDELEWYADVVKDRPLGPGRASLTGRVLIEGRTIQIPDVREDPEYSATGLAPSVPVQDILLRMGPTLLGVPVKKGDEILGVIIARRTERPVRPFSEREIGIIETFADQAAIAIDNVRLFRETEQKSRQLEVASRHKSEFLANMSHELRTPLNAIIGFTDVMLEEMFGPLNDKQKEYLEDVRNSGTHLLTLINDILDLSKVEAGRVELETAEFSFPEALDNALTLVRERATRHGITLASEVAKDVGTISADERKIKQILVNLLANAVKFTPDGGRVTVKAQRLNGEIEVAVHDTGIGVATEDQDRIFDEFQQVGRDPERSREGTGLGLTLAKRFVELHGGRIWVESEVGKGSTFTFAIPVRQTALADAKG